MQPLAVARLLLRLTSKIMLPLLPLVLVLPSAPVLAMIIMDGTSTVINITGGTVNAVTRSDSNTRYWHS